MLFFRLCGSGFPAAIHSKASKSRPESRSHGKNCFVRR